MSERGQRNKLVIQEFRSAGGVVAGDFKDVPLLLLTSTGARSGEPRTTPMTYLKDGARLVVFAANGGRESHPAWYHNILADPSAQVEVGTEVYKVGTRSIVVTTGQLRRAGGLRAACVRPGQLRED